MKAKRYMYYLLQIFGLLQTWEAIYYFDYLMKKVTNSLTLNNFAFAHAKKNDSKELFCSVQKNFNILALQSHL